MKPQITYWSLIMSTKNGSLVPIASSLFLAYFLLAVLFISFPYCTGQTNTTAFSRFYCNSYDNATDAAAFLISFNAAHADLRGNLSSPAATGFAISRIVRGAAPVYAIFHCRGYLTRNTCLDCLDDVFAIATANCSDKYRATVFTDGCYLRFAAVNIFSEVLNPGQSGFCDDPSPAEAGDAFNSAAYEALVQLQQEVLARDGGYVAGRKGTRPTVYAAGECLPILGSEDCRRCMESAVRNVEGCLPGAAGRAVESACFMRYSGEEFFNASTAVDLDQLRQGGGGGKSIIIGACVGVGAFLALLFLFLFYYRRSRQRSEWIFAGDIEGQTGVKALVSFTYQDLKDAARNFSNEYKLGQGGFSSVYKGVLRNGKVVAIKKLTISETAQAKTDFESEVIIISNIHHRNLLSLLGCCRRGPDLLLVYEFMEKGSLDRYISGNNEETLNWNKLFNIIVGSARGLTYLHEEFHHCIIHRDVKPGNILLDDEYQPKVGDFGLARLLPEDKTHVKTKLAGTLGYTAPEYVLNGKLSEKVDVYSFGVVILEILSGKKCTVTYEDLNNKYLLDWAWELYENDKLMDIVKKNILEEGVEEEEVKKVAEIGLMCTQQAFSRPSMSDVVTLLLTKDHPKFVLTRPTFIAKNAATNKLNYSDSSTSSSATKGTMLFSHFSGR